MEEISRNEFFDKFEKEDLAFVYQDRKINGETSYFNKLVSAETFRQKEYKGHVRTSEPRIKKRKEISGVFRNKNH